MAEVDGTMVGGTYDLSVGIDVGGTFTDVVAYAPDSGLVEYFKVSSRAVAPEEAVLEAFKALSTRRPERRISAIVHGTTIATNTLLEAKGAKTGLVTTRGFKDVLEIGRQHRTRLYDLANPGRPTPLVARALRLEVDERLNYKGAVLRPLDLHDAEAALRRLKNEGVESVAICLLHAYRNPCHEEKLRELFEQHFAHVSISSDLSREYREFERSTTVTINAYIKPRVSRYLAALDAGLRRDGFEGSLRLVQSNGGMGSVTHAKRSPVHMFMSGPAAGVAAAQFVLRQVGLDNAITLDMGGTSTDVCLLRRGKATLARQRSFDGRPMLLPSVDIETVGAGGGSLAWIDEVGALKVGPRSAGAEPGPACYGRGNMDPTVTDANLALGYLGSERPLGGAIRLKPDLATKALERLGTQCDLDSAQMAAGIIDIVNSHMIRALQLVSVERGYDARDFGLIVFGGAGPLHAGRLAEALEIPLVVVPQLSGVFSALGCLISDARYDATVTHHVRVDDGTSKELHSELRLLEVAVVSRMRADCGHRVEFAVQWSLGARYVGQNYELEIAVSSRPDGVSADEIVREFTEHHSQRYGYSTNEPIECVSLHVTVTVPSMTMPRPAGDSSGGRPGTRLEPSATRRAHFKETGWIDTPVYDRESLAVGAEIVGPATVEDEWSTVVILPRHRIRPDERGNLLMQVRP